MNIDRRITSPDDPQLTQLCEQLAQLSSTLKGPDAWPGEQLALCGRYGVFEWFISPELGGQGWSAVDVVRGYLRLSAACLTTTFVITQRTGACRRIAAAGSQAVRDRCLVPLITGRGFATVGISHLTTSRRHLAQPVLVAEDTGAEVVLSGHSPWVTGAAYADWIVTGATLADSRQVLAAVPRELPGVEVQPTLELVGLSASRTGPVCFRQVRVPRQWLLAGPAEQVMQSGAGASSGGLQTSTLAAGLSDAALSYLERECTKRTALSPAAASLRAQWSRLREDLLQAAAGQSDQTNEQLRTRANSLVLRSTHAALSAAKGAGFVEGHPVGRWCREALFFLVWSCPQSVQQAGLCELAGLAAAP